MSLMVPMAKPTRQTARLITECKHRPGLRADRVFDKDTIVYKRLLVNVVKYAVGLVLLAWIMWRNWTPSASGGIGLRDAFSGPVQFVPLVLAAAIFMTGVLLTFIRWYILVRAQELALTPVNALRLGLLGFFWNTFLPGSIGGDIVKATYIAREQQRRTVAVATVLIDRAMGLWGIIFVVAVLGGAFWILGNPIILGDGYLRSIIVASGVIVAATVCVWLVLGTLPARRAHHFAGHLGRIPKIGHSLAEFWRAVWMYRSKGGSVAVALLVSLASQLCFIFTFFYAGQISGLIGRDQMPTLADHFVLIPIGIAVQALFPSPGGTGGAQLMFSWLYGRVSEAMEPTGVLASFFRDVIAWGLGFIGYYVYLRMRPALPPAPEQEDVMNREQLILG
jgi:glycosyltransferase 2 family protein